ncbi:MAG: nitroreductase family protein [Paratractidigestivibacter faecalis]
MSVTDLMANRYSERRFSPAPVEDEKLQAILAAGALAPTAENKQPQRILVVRGDEALAKMDSARQPLPRCMVLAWAARHRRDDFGTVDIAIVETYACRRASAGSLLGAAPRLIPGRRSCCWAQPLPPGRPEDRLL